MNRRSEDLFQRVERVIRLSGSFDHEIVIGHNDRGSYWDQKLKSLIASFKDKPVVLTSKKSDHAVCCNSKLRNIAIRAARGEFIFFMDADIYPDFELFEKLAKKNANSDKSFSILPCFYLNKIGSKKLVKEFCPKEISQSFYQFSRRYVLHLAIPSSLLFVRRVDLNLIGNFDESYLGYGYEDFDLLLRVAFYFDCPPDDLSFLDDRPYSAPLLSFGFRKYLARYCLQEILDGNFAFHLYHLNSVDDEYFQMRKVNANYFQKKFSSLFCTLRRQGRESPVDLVNIFFDLCRNDKVDPRNFFALFDARPRHMHRVDGFLNKFKYLKGLWV